MESSDIQFLPSPSTLSLVQCGSQACDPGYFYGPAIRDHWLLHYVAEGKGTFRNDCGAFPVAEHQCFLIRPGEVTVYQADVLQPWTYGWVGFQGSEAAALVQQLGLSQEQPILSAPPGLLPLIQQMTSDIGTLHLGMMAALGGLYRFLALLAEQTAVSRSKPASQLYQHALWYMRGNFQRDIQIQQIADFVGLSRSQLFRIFIQESGIPPKQMLTKLRLEEAARLLKQSDLSILEISYSAGFPSPNHFSSQFRAAYQMTPSGFRKASHQR